MKSKRWKLAVAKYGSQKAARAEMRRRAEKSKRNKGGKGGFATLKYTNPEQFKQLTSKGGYARVKKIRAKKQKDFDSEISPDSSEAA